MTYKLEFIGVLFGICSILVRTGFGKRGRFPKECGVSMEQNPKIKSVLLL